ncbi:MAG TPA: DUF1566 domain-containing protein [Gammaproteobacteria bacterium]|nr:DUF1566 domain-containing protein [Gammaproteobacteria bacterium]
MDPVVLWTGQTSCHDGDGKEIDCTDSGQDAEYKNGRAWQTPRFEPDDDIVYDRLTGLHWSRVANFAEFPLTWVEALVFVQQMNADSSLGYSDWHMPNRRELRSLLDLQMRKPALPEGHPFTEVFLSWYWTSTTAAISPSHAWTVHMDGARMFYGGKDQSFLLWPVRGNADTVLPVTGQHVCYNDLGEQIACEHSGQDGEYGLGIVWPEPRFIVTDTGVSDRLTGLCWHDNANLTGVTVTWQQALDAIAHLNRQDKRHKWRLPNINELESLVDCSQSRPALPKAFPLEDVRETYWSSTTSLFEPDWAWALYMEKGATGVGQKKDPHFYVWPVC